MRGRVWATASFLSVGFLSGRLRRVALVVVVLLVGSLAIGTPAPALAADPVLPAGATLTPPKQESGSAKPLPPSTTEQSQGKRGPGAPASESLSLAVPQFPLSAPLNQPAPAEVSAGRAPAAKAAAASGPAAVVDAIGDGSVSGLKPGAVEVTSKRTPTSTEFANPDGSRLKRVYRDVQFVGAPDGSMTPLDDSLRVQPSGWLTPAASLSQASFAPVSDGSDVARLDLGDGVSLGFGVAGSARASASVSGSQVTYAGVKSGVDLQVSATRYGFKDKLVLRSAKAATTWLFPLRTQGVTPSWDAQSGQVQFLDRHGNVVGTIPPAFMQDSSVDPHSGEAAVSTHISQTLVQQGDGWALQLDLDPAWLKDKARVWPVIVDPTTYWYAYPDNDTWVSSNEFAGVDESASTDLVIGTYNGGVEKRAAYLDFRAVLLNNLPTDHVVSGGLALDNTYSYGCAARPVGLYAVTVPWSASTTTSYPGPAFDPNPLESAPSFAYGHSGCPPAAYAYFPIDGARLTAWAQQLDPFYGFTLRASETDSLGWKRFQSANNATVNTSPYLYLYYEPVSYVEGVLPTPGGVIDTLTPTLSANYFNPDTTFVRSFDYYVCNGTPAAPAGCHESGWTVSSSFQVPPGWLTTWNAPWFWQLRVSNNYSYTGWLTPFTAYAQLAQPGVTAHLAGAPEGSEMPGVNPQPGNYATTVTDASVNVAGPALALTRTYNSQDLRATGAFGFGWSTPWDQSVLADPDGSGNLLVTQPTGLVVRFGARSDGTYTPPAGMNLTLVHNTDGSWTERDPSGYRRTFDPSGRLASVIDPFGRTQTYTYDASQHLSAVTDAASGRALHVTWTGTTNTDHIATVYTDPPGRPRGPTPTPAACSLRCAPRWAPGHAPATRTRTSSHYRSVVLNDNPVGYWPLGETTGTTFANLAATTPGYLDATQTAVTLGSGGALTGSPDAAASFTGASASRIQVPNDTLNSSNSLALEIWFKAGTGQSGTLFGEQDTALPTTPSTYVPNLYVGTDHKLHGIWQGRSPMDGLDRQRR